MMHFCPELVHEDRIPKQKGKKHCPGPVIYPEPQGLVPESGILYSAEGASADIGRAMAEEIIETIGEILVKEF